MDMLAGVQPGSRQGCRGDLHLCFAGGGECFCVECLFTVVHWCTYASDSSVLLCVYLDATLLGQLSHLVVLALMFCTSERCVSFQSTSIVRHVQYAGPLQLGNPVVSVPVVVMTRLFCRTLHSSSWHLNLRAVKLWQQDAFCSGQCEM